MLVGLQNYQNKLQVASNDSKKEFYSLEKENVELTNQLKHYEKKIEFCLIEIEKYKNMPSKLPDTDKKLLEENYHLQKEIEQLSKKLIPYEKNHKNVQANFKISEENKKSKSPKQTL